MNTRLLNHTFILIFFTFFQIPCIIENELTLRNKSPELRNSEEETFGTVTLHFDNGGAKILVNVYDFSIENLLFFLKREDNLTEINRTQITVEDTKDYWEDSSKYYYYVKKVSYTLNNADEEIVIKIKEKPSSLRGLFAFSQATKITLENFKSDNVKSTELMFSECNSLTQLNISNWNTSSLTNMNSMFKNCFALSQLIFSTWNTSSVSSVEGMFRACKKLTQLNLSGWDTSNIKSMSYMFYDCLSLTKIDITGWDTSSVTNMDSMFYGCQSLTQLDISSWNTSSVTNMGMMFYYCKTLTQIDVINWNTSKVTEMNSMFKNCENLIQLDPSDWDTSKVTSMSSMFTNCYSLTQIDVTNWNTANVVNMISMFENCKNLKDINIESFKQSQITNIENAKNFLGNDDSLEHCRYSGDALDNMDQYFLRECSKLIGFSKCGVCENNQDEALCEKTITVGIGDGSGSSVNITKIFHYLEEEKTITNKLEKSCYWIAGLETLLYFNKTLVDKNHYISCDYSCRSCGIDTEMCKICNDGFYSLYNETSQKRKRCYNELNHPENYVLEDQVFISCDQSCEYSCKNKTILCGNCANEYYPLFNETNQEFKRCYNNLTRPENYYLENKVFKICDKSCKNSCNIESTLCDDCSNDYYPLSNETTLEYKRCYSELTIYENFYLYKSVEYKECHSRCGTCSEGPSETTMNCLTCKDENQVIVAGNCTKLEEILIKETLVYTLEDLKNNKLLDLLLNYSNTYYSNSVFIQQFMSNNITITLYNVGTENMNNSYLNKLELDIFKINFGSCYEKIIQKYNITEDLVYAQIDFLDNSDRVYYVLYDPKTNNIINLNICEDTEISISKNIELTEEMKNIINNANDQGYNIADINDPFYNDFCTPYTTINGTDITMSDRITDIYDKNFEIFGNYNNCEFESFNISANNVNVSCKSKMQTTNTETSFFEEIKNFDTKKLLNNFKFLESSNFYVVTCYKEFFSKEGQANNYANYIYYFIFTVVFILFVVYCFTGVNYLYITLASIAIKKLHGTEKKQKSLQSKLNKENTKQSDFFSNLKIGDSPSSINQYNGLSFNVKEENKYNPPKKMRQSLRKLSIKKTSSEYRGKSLNSQIIFVKEDKPNIKYAENKVKKERNGNDQIKIMSLEKIDNNQKNQKIIEEKQENIPEFKIINIPNETKNKKKIKKINNKNLNEVDLNEFGYDEALEFDKRTFLQSYCSYFHLKHPIFSLFYDNYNITAIKLILYVQSFGIHLCMNALFFREDTMHRIYIDNGKFNFIYRLPLTLYSVVISGIISFGLKKLVLTQNCVIEYKKQVKKLKNREDAIKKASIIIKCYKAKFIIFVILTILTLLIFWFYIGCFCTVYHNTQFILLKDSLIGFGLSMLYPICIFLAAVLFRTIALENNYSFLYKISKILA